MNWGFCNLLNIINCLTRSCEKINFWSNAIAFLIGKSFFYFLLYNSVQNYLDTPITPATKNSRSLKLGNELFFDKSFLFGNSFSLYQKMSHFFKNFYKFGSKKFGHLNKLIFHRQILSILNFSGLSSNFELFPVLNFWIKYKFWSQK